MRDDETMSNDSTGRSGRTVRSDEAMDSEELRHEIDDLHRGRPHATEEEAEALAQRLAGENVPYAENSPRDRGPEQARRAIEDDLGQSDEGHGQAGEDLGQGGATASGGPGGASMSGGQPSEVSSFQTSPLGDNDSVGTQEVTPPADLAQQRAQGPGHDYRVGATSGTADEDVEVMPRKKYRDDDKDRADRDERRP